MNTVHKLSVKRPPRQQSGVALAMALAMLTVLTILGLSAMKVSVLEVRMSGNVQDSTGAFQAAESGLAKALSDPSLLSLTGTNNTSYPVDRATVTVETDFTAFSTPARGSGYSATKYQMANFNQRAESTTTGGARSIVNQGQYQIVNKAE